MIESSRVPLPLFLDLPETLIVLIGCLAELLETLDFPIKLVQVVKVMQRQVIVASLLQDVEVELPVCGHN